jgi:hypothetical protein
MRGEVGYLEQITILKPTYLLGEHALYLLDVAEKVVDGYYMVGVPKIRPSVSSGQKTVSHNLKSPTRDLHPKCSKQYDLCCLIVCVGFVRLKFSTTPFSRYDL